MFHGNLVHASPPNITPYPRKIVYLTLCAVSNHITKFTRDPMDRPPRLHADRAGRRRRAAAVRARPPDRGGVAVDEPDAASCAARAAAGRPVRVGLIGAGKFGSMFLSQVPTIPGLEVAVIADLDPDRAREACRQVGWDAARIARTRFADAGARRLRRRDGVEVVIEATGNPAAGIAHALAAIEAGKHIVMVNVEADVLAGPLLAAKARAARRRLLDGLRRPAGADRRDGRLGAGGRLHGRRPPARAPSTCPSYHAVDAGRRLDPLRPDARGRPRPRA